MKDFFCCRLGDAVGDLWLALLLASVFAVALAAAVFAFLARLDTLPQRGCEYVPRQCTLIMPIMRVWTQIFQVAEI